MGRTEDSDSDLTAVRDEYLFEVAMGAGLFLPEGMDAASSQDSCLSTTAAVAERMMGYKLDIAKRWRVTHVSGRGWLMAEG